MEDFKKKAEAIIANQEECAKAIIANQGECTAKVWGNLRDTSHTVDEETKKLLINKLIDKAPTAKQFRDYYYEVLILMESEGVNSLT